MKRIASTIAVVLLAMTGAQTVFASSTDGTILSGINIGYAWSNTVGWINFGTVNGNVHVTDAGLTGYVWSALQGSINLAPTGSGVTNNDEGILGGYAWGAGLGWINFAGVTIDATGRFHGQATGQGIGTLTFDCTNCDVVTDWLPTASPPPPPPPPPPLPTPSQAPLASFSNGPPPGLINPPEVTAQTVTSLPLPIQSPVPLFGSFGEAPALASALPAPTTSAAPAAGRMATASEITPAAGKPIPYRSGAGAEGISPSVSQKNPLTLVFGGVVAFLVLSMLLFWFGRF